MWESTPILQKCLTVQKDSSNWQINGDYYQSPSECQFKPGTVNYGLAWYQQGMKVLLLKTKDFINS
jgi:hypothetical protein